MSAVAASQHNQEDERFGPGRRSRRTSAGASYSTLWILPRSHPRTVFASLADTGLEGHIWRVPLPSPRDAVRVPLAGATTLELGYSAGTLAYIAGSIRVPLREYRFNGATVQDSRILAASNNIDIEPRLAPDGTRLALGSNRSGAYDVWVVDLNGKDDPRRINWLNGGNFRRHRLVS